MLISVNQANTMLVAVPLLLTITTIQAGLNLLIKEPNQYPLMTSAIILIIACLLNYFLGELKRFHQLIGYGMRSNKLECHFNNVQTNSSVEGLVVGVLCWLALVTPLPLLYDIKTLGFFPS